MWGAAGAAATAPVGGVGVGFLVGASIVIGRSPSGTPHRTPAGWDESDDETKRPFPREEGSSIPYLAGGPARIWHLADVAAGRLSGFTGPVPPPLLIRLFSCR